MARSKGPNLADPNENPAYSQHVSNVSNMIGSATPEQRIAGVGWYRKAAQDTAHIASGIHPGTMVPHPTQGDVGLTHDKPGTSPAGAHFTRNALADAAAEQMGHARSLGQGQAESLARTGTYPGQRVSHANDQGRPFGLISHSPAVHRTATAIAAMSPAGPTGMTWADNPRAVAESQHLSEGQFGAIAHANTLKPGTPERQEASAVARAPFGKGSGLNHQTTPNIEKGMRALRGDYDAAEHPLGMQKTQHFANDIEGEFTPAHPQNFGGMTGTVDKHQEDVIAGVTKPWGNKDAGGNQQRQISTRLAGEDSLPKLSSDAGYNYQRGVVQAAAAEHDMRPKDAQAVSWVTQKAVKDSARRGGRA